jgi:hypothetical protein
MNKEKLTDRLQEIETATINTNTQINQLMANLNVLQGSKNEAEHWLSKIDEVAP